MTHTINQETCKKCKACMEVCPCNCIGLRESNEMYFIPERESVCLHCGQCMCVCKTKSVNVCDYSYNKELFDLPETTIHYDQLSDFFATRRSVRNFSKKHVSKEVIQKIVDSIAFAPYGAAPDEVHITAINNREIIELALPLMSEFYDNLVTWIDNPFIRFMIRQKNSQEKFSTVTNHVYPIAKLGNYKLEFGDRITRNAPALLIFHADKSAEAHTNNSLIYATYAMLAAHSLGLGATIVELVPAAINRVNALKESFKIPQNHEAVISLILGYPKLKYRRAIRREKRQVSWIT